MSFPDVSWFFITFSVLGETGELTDAMAESKEAEVILNCYFFTTVDQLAIQDRREDPFHLIRRLWNDPTLYNRWKETQYLFTRN